MIYNSEYSICPRCESENYIDTYSSIPKSEIQHCYDCGYSRGYRMIKSKNKHDTSDIYVGIETLSENPFGAYELKRNDGNGVIGTLETKNNYANFVSTVNDELNNGKNIKKATVSRLIHGKIIKETIFPK